MNIAICDDDRLMSGQIEKLVEQVFHGETSKYNTEVFFSGDRLLDFLEQSPNYFHMYLLDIEMEGADGLETAARIREADSDAVIIFMTSHAELMSEAFEVLAFQFIIKPLIMRRHRAFYPQRYVICKNVRVFFNSCRKRKSIPSS